MVDTLRADHTSLYGYERPTTPFLEELGAQSVVFERARAQAGCTFPSVNSILTSRYPFDFYRHGPGNMGIPDAFPSIAEILKGLGHTTIAVSASPIVRATPSKFNPSAGFGRGFDIFDESCLWRSAECVNKRAIELLTTVEGPFFLYLHYMDPHDPYLPPAAHDHRFAGAFKGPDFIAAGNPNPIAEMLYDGGPEVDFDERDIQHMVDLYDEEILYFDTMLGELVGGLDERGILDHSVLVVTSDHGEEFLEHGHVKHCRGVWDTLTRVPLIIRFPGGRGARIVETPVQLIDLLPTVLESLGVSADGLGMEGVNLRPLLEGATPPRDLAFSDQERYRSVDDGNYHLILDGMEWSFSLFETRSDPLEQHNLYTTDPDRATRFEGALTKWLEDSGQWDHFDMTLRAAKEHEDQLRALGYLE